jgi:hypothetical protein
MNTSKFVTPVPHGGVPVRYGDFFSSMNTSEFVTPVPHGVVPVRRGDLIFA